MRDAAWNSPAVPFDFFDAKGVLENLARELALPKVRVQLRDEIRRIQLEAGTTTVFVTHDQEEALAVADRMGVENPKLLYYLFRLI